MFTSADILLYSIMLLLLPLLGYGLIVFFSKYFARIYSLGIGFVATSLVLSVVILFGKLNYFAGSDIEFSFTWLTLGGSVNAAPLNINMGVLIDNYTAIMLVVVTLVSSLVHIYSLEYMKSDKRFNRYYAYLSLFTFSMLGLVLADNLLAMFAFWELVGLSSYLLIGFWFEKKSASDAGKKAFIVNRIGDVGFLIGILILFVNYDTFSFGGIFNQITADNLPFGSEVWLTAAGILLFMGAVGKSAQVPLHVWLPDAMEGPTPVSALIHAATMVAAGVFLLIRVFPILSSDALLVIAVIGMITSFVAALIALTQNDIKKILAYSTISQLGYMVIAIGVGAYAYAFFHLVTHAFFKACLFLGAGSVIMANHHEMDIRKYGNLRKHMPITYVTFYISALAISGIPLTAGFLSKDGILANTLGFASITGHWLIPGFAFLTAFLTAFYMFRLVVVAFHGKDEEESHVKESPYTVTIPLMILSALSLFFWFTLNPFSTEESWVVYVWIEKLVSVVPASLLHLHPFEQLNHAAEDYHITAMVLSFTLSVGGILLAFLMYQWKKIYKDKLVGALERLYLFSLNKFYADEIYEALFVKRIVNLSAALNWFDEKIIDRIVNGFASVTKMFSKIIDLIDFVVIDGLVNLSALVSGFAGFSVKKLQTGKVQTYIVFLIFSVIVLLFLFQPF